MLQEQLFGRSLGRMALGKDPGQEAKLTSTLLTVAITVSFGTWFAMGYLMVALNGLQFTIVNWIRAVKCQRLAGVTFQRTNDSTSLDLWCRRYEPNGESNILAENSELNIIWAVSSSVITVGGLLATFTCTSLVPRLGRKGSLFFTSGLYITGTVMFASSKWAASFELLIAGRFIVGCSMAYICVVAPLYITDLTSPRLRGSVGTIPVIFYDVGLVLGTSFSLPMLLGTDDGWPFLILIPCLPALALCLALPFFPDSPRSLLVNQDNEKARAALVWLRRTPDVDEELAAIQSSIDNEVKDHTSVIRFFRTPFLRSTFLICFVAMVSQQFSGYQCIVFYSTSIFNSVGLTQNHAVYATTGLWITLLCCTLLSSALMEKLGRRMLILGGNFFEGLSLALLVIFMAMTKQGHEWTKNVSVACLFTFVASYGMGPITVPWILPTELFNAQSSATAMTWTAVTSWAAALLSTFIFPVVVSRAEEYTFIIFIGILLLSSVFLYFRQPETKGRSAEAVQAALRRGKRL
ncbi:hypothetical protein RvY_02223 [Ramazzottius varieornatus]|uniref:Major facilitator superfamily (MFS) profile domain-containing protein n=1 Tax=Ramazzottius varieornatus TaxID=947166 RepID=A0A1D1UR10_RAMVA|nr:hypothetical protein RvY_02223 [Ramazzottius varieornatus]